MDESVLIPNVSKKTPVILTPDQLRAKLDLEELRQSFRLAQLDAGIDPDSDEGLLANPHESFVARKAWLEVVAHHKNKKRSEEGQYIYDFFTKD